MERSSASWRQLHRNSYPDAQIAMDRSPTNGFRLALLFDEADVIKRAEGPLRAPRADRQRGTTAGLGRSVRHLSQRVRVRSGAASSHRRPRGPPTIERLDA